MRIGIRLAVSGLVLVSILASAVAVHALWWRTANASSRALAVTINQQIVASVEKEIASTAAEARAAYTAIRTLFMQGVLETREPDKREFVFLSQLQSQQTLSWIALGFPDGSFHGAHKIGEERLEMIEISPSEAPDRRRVDRYKVVVGDIEFEQRSFQSTAYAVTEQQWYKAGVAHDVPRWLSVTSHPTGTRPAIAYAGPIDVYARRHAVLAIMIEHARLSRFLSRLSVGRTGAAFIVGRGGTTVAAPDANADGVNRTRADQPLLRIAHRAMTEATGRYDADLGPATSVRLVADGIPYAVTLTPLAFPGWTLATVIPEAEFLGSVEETLCHLLVGLAFAIMAAAMLSAGLARRIIAAPLLRVAAELRHIERFELGKVQRHTSRLAEIQDLSAAIADMASGLAAFGKYIPSDMVRLLLARGIAPVPGGHCKPMTVMFADIAGFTGMSERMGERIIPLLSTCLELMAREISAHGGTVDKFIGDAVMAFWGAPADNRHHAIDACRAALACQRAIRAAGLADDEGRPLKVRIGINSGDMLVGNIGSDVRLNYTVIGDPVNVASRLEGANKTYGTEIIIGEQTRALAGAAVHLRELDRLKVHGRAGGLAIYELLGTVDRTSERPGWVALYEAGLAAYRARDFSGALGSFLMLLTMREWDQPARLMIERCRELLETPPGESWEAASAMQAK